MNQILITKKLYITPELKKKKKMYKFEFFLSVLVLCALIGAYVYAEYDRNKNEQESQEILASLDIPEEDTTVADSKVLVVVLNENEGEVDAEEGEIANTDQNSAMIVNRDKQKTKSGYTYSTVATISIPKLNIKYPILDGVTDSAEETEELLKISLVKFWGPEPNDVGNFCIVGHNYRNTKFFSKISTLQTGDVIDITDMFGKTLQYKVYNQYVVDPTDVSCTSQLTNGKKEITLITCTTDSKHRTIIKARESN